MKVRNILYTLIYCIHSEYRYMIQVLKTGSTILDWILHLAYICLEIFGPLFWNKQISPTTASARLLSVPWVISRTLLDSRGKTQRRNCDSLSREVLKQKAICSFKLDFFFQQAADDRRLVSPNFYRPKFFYFLKEWNVVDF